MAYRFTADDDVDFALQTLLGGVAYGAGDVGEILTTFAALTPGDQPGWATAFSELGQRIEEIAGSARRAGARASAGAAYLRAATYYAAALDGLLGTEDDPALLASFRDHRRCWDAFAELHQPALQRVTIPYPDHDLPGYFLSVDGAKRPTVIAINGSDGPLTWVWTLAKAAQEHGYNTLLFDGPGQQSMLFEHQVAFRPDWEHVIGPVVDVLVQRADVDPDALVLWGGSQGGYWCPRALAFESRIAAGVADPGVVDVGSSWFRHLPPEVLKLLAAGDKADFDAAMGQWLSDPSAKATWTFRARPYGSFDPFEVFSKMRAYDLTAVAGQIKAPMFICDPEGEQFWPGQSSRLADLVGGSVELSPFTAAEGAALHCEPMARTLAYQRMFDWLATVLPSAG
ncbi:MAG: dipeptidyl aminopeptidase [Actinobacteria bacterium]|nr:MAG: dipeptidyl aminopeptidase [Actinomycetota bacterium]